MARKKIKFQMHQREMEIMERITAENMVLLVVLESLAKKYTIMLAAMADGIKRRSIMKTYHHGRYSFNN
jgi:hypothetical protein